MSFRKRAKLGIKAGHGRISSLFLFCRKNLPHAFAAADLGDQPGGSQRAHGNRGQRENRRSSFRSTGSANNHQEQNAFAFSQAGAAIVLEQGNLGRKYLLGKNRGSDGETRNCRFELSERIKKFYNPQAAENIAEEMIKLPIESNIEVRILNC